MPHVWLIEDSQGDAVLVEEALKERCPACSLMRYRDVSDAVKAAETAQPRPHAILLDPHLPRSHGTDTIISLKACPHLADLPIYILTGSEDRHLHAKLMEKGAVAVWTKPTTWEGYIDLAERVRNLRS